MQFTDEWLVPTVEVLVPEEAMLELRNTDAEEPVSLWETLVRKRLVTDDQIMTAIATRFRLPLAEMHKIDPKVRDAVPEQLARTHSVIPLKITDSYLVAATANPFDIDAEKMLAFATGREVRLHLCPPGAIRQKLDEVYQPENVVSKLLGDLDSGIVEQVDDDEDELGTTFDEASQRPIVRLVDMMLADGISSRASDIHIEPSEGGVIVRYRIDGVLRQVMKIPRSAGLPLISRMKIISGLDIADRLRPQDGRARVAVNHEKIDLRISTLPASLGEKVVVRILNANALELSLEALGMLDDEREQVAELLSYKEGVVLVTGQPQAWDDGTDASSVQAELLAGLQRLVTQTATLVDQHEAAEPLPVWIISRGGQPVEESSTSDPRAAATAALSQVIDQEYVELRCRVLDLPRTLAATPAAAHVLASLGWCDPPPLAAWREETAWVRHWRPSDVSRLADGHPPLRSGGVYLLSGGQGNIGLELAARLAAAGTHEAPVRLVLASRQPLPESSQWDAYLAAPTSETLATRIAGIQKLQQEHNVEVWPVALDVADESATAELLAEIDRRYGRLDGVVHAA